MTLNHGKSIDYCCIPTVNAIPKKKRHSRGTKILIVLQCMYYSSLFQYFSPTHYGSYSCLQFLSLFVNFFVNIIIMIMIEIQYRDGSRGRSKRSIMCGTSLFDILLRSHPDELLKILGTLKSVYQLHNHLPRNL